MQSVKPSDLVYIVVVWFSVVVGQAVRAAGVSSCSVDRMWSGSGFAGDVQAEVAPGFGSFVVLICQRGADEADQAVRSKKMSTTSMRRRIGASDSRMGPRRTVANGMSSQDRGHRSGRPRAQNSSAVGIDDDGYVGEPGPGRRVRKVSHANRFGPGARN